MVQMTSRSTLIIALALALTLAISFTLLTYFRAVQTTGSTNIVVVGDSFTSGSAMGGTGTDSWVSIIKGRIATDYPVEVHVSAAPGSGYASGETTFLDQVTQAVNPDTDIVVIFGSRNDWGVSSVGQKVYETISEAVVKSENVEVVVVGPPWSGLPPAAASFSEMKNEVRDQAARFAGVVFVDPIQDGWFTGTNHRLIGSDGIHPTNLGQVYIADLLEPVIREVLTEKHGRP